jgi:hypothetical protein
VHRDGFGKTAMAAIREGYYGHGVLLRVLSGDLYQRSLVWMAATIQTAVPRFARILTEKNPAG